MRSIHKTVKRLQLQVWTMSAFEALSDYALNRWNQWNHTCHNMQLNYCHPLQRNDVIFSNAPQCQTPNPPSCYSNLLAQRNLLVARRRRINGVISSTTLKICTLRLFGLISSNTQASYFSKLWANENLPQPPLRAPWEP